MLLLTIRVLVGIAVALATVSLVRFFSERRRERSTGRYQRSRFKWLALAVPGTLGILGAELTAALAVSQSNPDPRLMVRRIDDGLLVSSNQNKKPLNWIDFRLPVFGDYVEVRQISEFDDAEMPTATFDQLRKRLIEGVPGLDSLRLGVFEYITLRINNVGSHANLRYRVTLKPARFSTGMSDVVQADACGKVNKEYKEVDAGMGAQVVAMGTNVVRFSGDDLVRVSYSWDYAGEEHSEFKYIEIDTGREVGAPSWYIPSGFAYAGVLTPAQRKLIDGIFCPQRAANILPDNP